MRIADVAPVAGGGRRIGRVCVIVAVGAVAALGTLRAPSTAVAQVVSHQVETPAVPASAATPTVQLHMPDGQIKSHSLRVYVTRELRDEHQPRLRLLWSPLTGGTAGEDALRTPLIVSPGQVWFEIVNGEQVPRSGTLLLFDINGVDFRYKAMVRVTPVVSWTEDGVSRTVVGDQAVNVGNVVAALGWTFAVVGLTLLLLYRLAKRGGTNPLLLFAGVGGHLSLAQSQIACWTVVVGGVVLGYGLIRLQIPEIPESLLALMGASLATGGIGFFQDAKNRSDQAGRGQGFPQGTFGWADLVRTYKPGQPPELSLAKAQMLFWTVLLLALFMVKSILEGAIWEVPWALVFLMGFSQAGYLAPKLTEGSLPPPGTTQP